jgi:hypothetical protein
VSSTDDSDAPGASSSRPSLDDALADAVANAALEGIALEADEQALIRLHQSGGTDRDEFLRRARAIAQRKARR